MGTPKFWVVFVNVENARSSWFIRLTVPADHAEAAVDVALDQLSIAADHVVRTASAAPVEMVRTFDVRHKRQPEWERIV